MRTWSNTKIVLLKEKAIPAIPGCLFSASDIFKKMDNSYPRYQQGRRENAAIL